MRDVDDQLAVIKNLGKFGFTPEVKDPPAVFYRMRFVHENGDSIDAEYDGGGAWKFDIYRGGVLVTTIKENDYQSLTTYLSTGNAQPHDIQMGDWRGVTLCGS